MSCLPSYLSQQQYGTACPAQVFTCILSAHWGAFQAFVEQNIEMNLLPPFCVLSKICIHIFSNSEIHKNPSVEQYFWWDQADLKSLLWGGMEKMGVIWRFCGGGLRQ